MRFCRKSDPLERLPRHERASGVRFNLAPCVRAQLGSKQQAAIRDALKRASEAGKDSQAVWPSKTFAIGKVGKSDTVSQRVSMQIRHSLISMMCVLIGVEVSGESLDNREEECDTSTLPPPRDCKGDDHR